MEKKYTPCLYKSKDECLAHVFHYGGEEFFCDNLNCNYNDISNTLLIEREGDRVGICTTRGMVINEKFELVEKVVEATVDNKEKENSQLQPA